MEVFLSQYSTRVRVVVVMSDSRSGKCSRKWKCFVTIFYEGKGGGGHV